ncbi:Hypothetical predicted protein [Paramuricea clavata]|uniref:Uncharacterized protein n=1 Tax=Paramuricea clavata TaxID=317549 RepID=A0A7D9D7A1_PARCT|nr:Hypothetical predicted protein [Paramuricea clavata]
MEERGIAHTFGSTTVPSVQFVDDAEGLPPDVIDAFNDSFDASWEDIEERLSKLKKFSEDRLTAEKKRDVVQAKEKLALNPRNKNVRELIKRSSIRTLNDGTENSPALREYKELVRKIREEPATSTRGYTNEGDDESVVTDAALNEDDPGGSEVDTFEDIELIDVRVTRYDIQGLTPKENSELRGVLNPTDTID